MLEEQPGRYLAWEACYNARDVGGYPAGNGRRIRWRALVRADNLHRLTLDGQAALRDYGVRTIIDLRLAHELERHPNPFAAQQGPSDVPRYLHLPLHDLELDATLDEAEWTQAEYVAILERAKELVAAVIKAVVVGLEDGHRHRPLLSRARPSGSSGLRRAPTDEQVEASYDRMVAGYDKLIATGLDAMIAAGRLEPCDTRALAAR